jgi:hypothetical protein
VNEHARTLDRRQIRRFEFAGKRTRGKWPSGTYTGQIVLTRGTGAEVRREVQTELR